jgi:hypothetical protein
VYHNGTPLFLFDYWEYLAADNKSLLNLLPTRNNGKNRKKKEVCST